MNTKEINLIGVVALCVIVFGSVMIVSILKDEIQFAENLIYTTLSFLTGMGWTAGILALWERKRRKSN